MPPPQPIAKRLLFPNHSTIPPLLLSSPHLDHELYDFIALALRAFVVPWWSKISRYDKEFLPQITHVLTTVIRVLEARLLAADIPLLLLHHVPIIITQHYRDYRNATAKLSTSYASAGAASLSQLFHQLQPHMAVSSDGRIDTEYLRQVVDRILNHCLPHEDYQPDAERFIIREVIVKLVLNDVIPKISQPWFIEQSILLLLQNQLPPKFTPFRPSSYTFHNLLVLFLSAVQSISGACLALIEAYKQTVNTIKRVHQIQPEPKPPNSRPIPSLSPSPTASTSSLPSPPATSSHPTPGSYSSPPLIMISKIFTFHQRIAATTLFTIIHMLTTLSSSFLDRLFPHFLMSHLSPSFLLTTMRLAKRTLFPNGYPGSSPPEPSPEEQSEVRARLVSWRPVGVLSHLTPFILGPDPSKTLGEALDPLSSAPCNVHLVLLLLDCIVVTLFPELAVDGMMDEGDGIKSTSV